MKTILYDFDNLSMQEFDTLVKALQEAWAKKVTGNIVTPINDIIVLKKGKRKMADGKWKTCLPC